MNENVSNTAYYLIFMIPGVPKNIKEISYYYLFDVSNYLYLSTVLFTSQDLQHIVWHY